jgi:hypothetical protein
VAVVHLQAVQVAVVQVDIFAVFLAKVQAVEIVHIHLSVLLKQLTML